MFKYIIASIILLQSVNASAQTIPANTDPVAIEAPADKVLSKPEKGIYSHVQKAPAFKGDLNAYLAEQIRYPDAARENQIQGQVIVRFVVRKSGQLTDVEIARSVERALDNEALRVVRAMPKWEPGIQNGKAVDTYYTLPISFKL